MYNSISKKESCEGIYKMSTQSSQSFKNAFLSLSSILSQVYFG